MRLVYLFVGIILGREAVVRPDFFASVRVPRDKFGMAPAKAGLFVLFDVVARNNVDRD